ncbi:MAG: MarR family transcriptional regulator [Hyphomicrobiales bacterium]|nr:MAG: MarR family transcriptional regulator [Hyphomicrobiales bacterium]
MTVSTPIVGMPEAEAKDIKSSYLDSLNLIERLHRHLLDVIKDEFERMGRVEINPVQALLLYNVGESELTAGELRSRGHYLGSNVSYNLKKLVDAGYVHHKRSSSDRRSVRVSLTEKGKSVCNAIDALYDRHMHSIEQVGGLSAGSFMAMNQSLRKLERFWTDQIRYRL